MKFKILSLIVVAILLIMTVFAGPKAPLRAQETPEPEVTEDPCATPEATPEESLDSEDTPVPEVTEDPCATPEATPEATTEAQATPTPTATVTKAPEGNGAIKITHSNDMVEVIRIWVTWHDPSTGALFALPPTYLAKWANPTRGSAETVITIPKNAVNIGIRIEQQAHGQTNFGFNPTCAFAFSKLPEKVEGLDANVFITVDSNFTCRRGM